jgi:hypothetical protein
VRSLENIPLESEPSDMVVGDRGEVWFALPGQSSIGLYVPDAGLRYIRLGFKATHLAYSAGAVAAYSPGSLGLAIIEAASARVVLEASGPGMIDAVVPVDAGFALIRKLPTITLLQHVSPSGKVLWETSISVELERYGVAAGSGRYVWLRTQAGHLLMVEIGREGYKEFKPGLEPLLLASAGGKVWAISREGEAALVSVRGVERRVDLKTRVYLGDEALALEADRLVLLSPVTELIIHVSGSEVVREALYDGVAQAALRGGSEVYILGKSLKNILVASLSRPPTISDASATPSEDGASIRLRARVSDPDNDLAEGPTALAMLGTTVVTAAMSKSGDTYYAELRVPEGEGTLRVMVEASDAGGNRVRVDVGAFEVSGGRVKSSGTPPPQTVSGQEFQSLIMLSVELSLFVVLIAAAGIVVLSRSRRRRRR